MSVGTISIRGLVLEQEHSQDLAKRVKTLEGAVLGLLAILEEAGLYTDPPGSRTGTKQP